MEQTERADLTGLQPLADAVVMKCVLTNVVKKKKHTTNQTNVRKNMWQSCGKGDGKETRNKPRMCPRQQRILFWYLRCLLGIRCTGP